MFWNKPPPIYETIDEYVAWKADRHPLIAGGQRSILYRFVNSYSIKHVEDISDYQIAFFIGEELTAFYGAQAMKALRAFLHFCHLAGYEVISWRMVTETNLKKVTGRPTDWDMVRRVKEMREGRGLSYKQISDELSTLLGRTIWRPNVIRWYKKAPELP